MLQKRKSQTGITLTKQTTVVFFSPGEYFYIWEQFSGTENEKNNSFIASFCSTLWL